MNPDTTKRRGANFKRRCSTARVPCLALSRPASPPRFPWATTILARVSKSMVISRPRGRESRWRDTTPFLLNIFETMRIPLLRGRDIRALDGKNSQHVAIINGAMADRYWHGQDPIGRHFSATYDPSHPMQVIGIVKNSYEDDIFEQDPPFFFVPLAQYYNSFTTLQVRTATSPEAMAREVTGLIHSLERR